MGNVTHNYTIQAKSGQSLSTAITGSGLLITVLNAQGIALSDAVNVLNANVQIAVDGVYTVQLKGLGGTIEVPYQLKLGLKDIAIATPLTSPPLVSPTPTTAIPAPNPPRIEIKVN